LSILSGIARARFARHLRLLSTPLFIIVLLLGNAASSAPVCRDLPSSKLRLYSAHATGIEVVSATRSEMDSIANEFGVSSVARAAHPLMLIIATVPVVWTASGEE
jgi:hypothetical protein